MKNINSGIYKISTLTTNRIYIGSALNMPYRWKQHLNRLRRGIHHSIKLQRHFNKYGEADLVFTIMEPCLPMGLLVREQEYLDSLNPYFNTCKIAGSSMGVIPSAETIEKLRIAHKGQKAWNKGLTNIYSKETLQKMSEGKKGVAHTWTENAKLKLSNTKRGKKFSAEHCNNISIAKKGKETWMKGKKHSPESIEKMRLNMIGRIRGPYKKRSN